MALKSKIPPKMLKKVLKNRKSGTKGFPKIPSKKESRVVSADNLNWKTVDIPDTLDDFGGFYGLEEIDGVGVKVVNGKVEFVTKEEDNVKDAAELKETEAKVQEEQKTKNQDEDDENEQDDNEEPPLKKLKLNKKEEKKANIAKLKTEKKLTAKKQQDKQLETSGFEALEELDEVDLPDWTTEDLSLSSYTLQGLQKLKFTQPTLIQKKTLPIALSGRDVVGKAMTGSGKTYAYGIPILERYLASQKQTKTDEVAVPTGIIFAPTRELAHQVTKHLESLARYSPVTVNGIISITGGLSIQKQERLLSRGPPIIVATPGRMLELLEKNKELAIRLASTDILVLFCYT